MNDLHWSQLDIDKTHTLFNSNNLQTSPHGAWSVLHSYLRQRVVAEPPEEVSSLSDAPSHLRDSFGMIIMTIIMMGAQERRSAYCVQPQSWEEKMRNSYRRTIVRFGRQAGTREQIPSQGCDAWGITSQVPSRLWRWRYQTRTKSNTFEGPFPHARQK